MFYEVKKSEFISLFRKTLEQNVEIAPFFQ